MAEKVAIRAAWEVAGFASFELTDGSPPRPSPAQAALKEAGVEAVAIGGLGAVPDLPQGISERFWEAKGLAEARTRKAMPWAPTTLTLCDCWRAVPQQPLLSEGPGHTCSTVAGMRSSIGAPGARTIS